MWSSRPDLARPAPSQRPASEGAPAPYLFDRDTSKGAPDPGAAERQAAMATARAEGYDAGLAAGRRSAEAAAAEALSVAARGLGEALSALVSSLDDELARLRREAATAALATGAQLARHLVEREPLAEIEALIGETLAPLREVPHLVVRVREQESAALSGRIDALAAQHGFSGRILIVGDPQLGAGDCRIEWANGGIVRDMTGAAAGIDNALKRRFPLLPPPLPGLPEGSDQ